MKSYTLIESDRALDNLLPRLIEAEHYALDTEFHREHTYYPQLALVQVAYAGEIAIVDPLRVDMTPLRSVLEGPGTAVIHASSQDLEVLLHVCGVVPQVIFDTQVAAAFVGMGSPSLGTLYERLLGLSVPKASQLSNWLARPLDGSQLSYAATDVAHLPAAREALVATLKSLGRLEWVMDECAQLVDRAKVGRDPQEAWRKIKELRSLKGRSMAVGRAVAAWREERAALVDQPVRRILSDIAVAGLAQKPPSNLKDMSKIRGIDDRMTRSESGEALLEVISASLEAPLPKETKPPPKRSRDNRAPASLISALITQKARDLGIDASYLATRSDIEAFLEGDPESRILHGWRRDLVGTTVRQIADGDVALAFTDQGDLVIEKRSHIPA